MTNFEQHQRTLYLLFSPSCVPWAEVATYHLNACAHYPQLKLGLSSSVFSNVSSLILPPGPFSSMGKKSILEGKYTVVRYFSRLHSSGQLYEKSPFASEIDECLDWIRSNKLSQIFSKINEGSHDYIHSSHISISDLLAWDAIKSGNIPVKDRVLEWKNRIESLPAVQKALLEIQNTLKTLNLNDFIKSEIAKFLQDSIPHPTDFKLLYGIIEVPRDKSKGDLAVPLPRLRIPNMDWKEHVKILCSQFKPTEWVLEAFPSDTFISFNLNKDKMRKFLLHQIHDLNSEFGSNASGFGQSAIVEYSSPNIAKPFHAGHLRSTIIGAFVKNVLEKSGWATLSMNYLGDWGKQYGLLAIGYEKYGSDSELEKDPIRHLYDVYVKINADATEDPSIHDKARLYFKRMEDGDTTALDLWQRFRDLSIVKYKEIYSRLNVSFDIYSGESQYSLSQMKSVLEELTSLGLLVKDDGALLVDLKQYKLGAAIIGKTDGSMLYLSRDIAANIERKKLYNFDEMFYIVGGQQDHHFSQLFKILELMGKDWAGKCHHINFGMIKSKDGNMSTRKGTVVFLEEILNNVQDEMHSVMQRNESRYAQIQNPLQVSDTIGISAIMYQDMSARRNKDYEFDWNRMLSFEGDTGPYLQYAHARICSIERSAIEMYGEPTNVNLDLLTEDKAKALVDALAYYPDVVREASKNMEPCNVVTYITKLAHTLSSALDTLYVLNQEKEVAHARLYMYSAVRMTIGNGMRLLGLKPLERM